jgi:hypothetical protein
MASLILRQLHLRERVEDRFPSSSLDSETNQPEVRQLGEDYPSLPDEYFSFQLTVGCGTMGKGQFQIYGSVQEPEEVFGWCPAMLPRTALLVGDDYAGTYVGYLNRAFIEYDSKRDSLRTINEFGITEYMEAWLDKRTAEEENDDM